MDLQTQYFTKALEAYQRKEYKYCLILLKKVPLSEYKTVNLVVNCSYDFWKETVIATADSKAVSRQGSRPSTAGSSSAVGHTVRKFAGIEEQKSISELMSAGDDVLTRDAQLVLDAIKDSFTQMLANVKVVPIKQYDYIRLTHVYLAEGSLHGALQILQLASARGFLEDPLIVLQSYTIMRRISKEVDVHNTMTYLSSTLVVEAIQRKRSSTSRQGQRIHKQDRLGSSTVASQSSTQVLQSLKTTIMRDGFRLNQFPLNLRPSTAASVAGTLYVSESDLPMQFMFLHCAAYVQRQAQQNRRPAHIHQKYLSELTAILSEAYFLVRNEVNEDVPTLLAWFNDPQLWYDMALSLDVHSPYVLLAQDSYWESFTRSSLEEAHILGYINSLIRNKRRSDVPGLLAQAMEVNPWNLFVRQSLYELDMQLVSNPNERQWVKLLDRDDYYCRQVQKHVRGWRLRSHWDEIFARAKLRKDRYQARKQRALSKFAAFWRSHQRTVFVGWKVYVEDWKALKHHSCAVIQALYRGRLWRIWYAWYRQRIAQANYMYLIAYQQLRDKHRVRAFQSWHAEYMKVKRRKSADLITDVLYMNGYSRILRTGMDFIVTVIRVKRKYAYRRVLQSWHQRFVEQRRRRARCTIRFFARRCAGRKAAAEKEEQLAQVLEVMQQKAAVMFRKSDLPMLRKVWGHWRHEYMLRVNAQVLVRLSQQLALLFFQKRAREMRRGLRARIEAQTAFVKQTWHRKVYAIFKPWRTNAGARIIQRAFRVRRAAKIYHRLLKINYGVDHLREEHKLHWKARVLRCWQKYNYLVRRERARAARWIVRLFRMIMLRGLIRRKCAAKVAMGNLAHTLHRSYLGLSLRRLKTGTVYAGRFIVLTKMTHALSNGTQRAALYRWAALLSAQRVTHRLSYLQSVKPVEKRFWVGAACSVEMQKVDAPTLDYLGTSSYSHNGSDAEHAQPIIAAEVFRDISDVHKSTTVVLASLIAQCAPYEARYKPFERYVAANPVVLLSNEQRWRLRTFRAWMALYRLRQRCLRGAAHDLATHIVATTQHWCLRRLSAAYRIQNLYRVFHARSRVYKLRQRLRQRQDRLDHIRLKEERRAKRRAFMAYMRARIIQRNLIIRMQCFMRKNLARRNFHNFYSRYSHLRGGGNRVRAAYHQRLLRDAIAMFQMQYCFSLCRAITMPGADTRQRFAELGGEDASLRPAKKVKLSSRDAVFARLQVKQPARQQSRATEALGDRSVSFQSEECRQHLLRLRETGTFIFDCGTSENPGPITKMRASTGKLRSSTGEAKRANQPPGEPRLHPHLTDEELAFCLQNADVVFCQQARKAALRAVITQFAGSKLVLRGGELAAGAVGYLLYNYLRQPALPPHSTAGGDVEENALTLQLSGVSMGMSARLALVRSIAAQKPPETAKSALAGSTTQPNQQVPADYGAGPRVSALIVDTDSFGLLGSAVLLASLQVR
jgi:hypothetical protein